MPKYLILVLLFFVSLDSSYSHACKPITEFDEYNKSEIIALGYITEKRDGHFIVNIIEVFKGEDISLGSKVHGLLGDGLVNPNIGETWLLYGSFSEEILIVDICGHSRSFNRPYSIGGSSIPPPPASGESSEERENLIANIYLNRALSELRHDILGLRHRRLQEEFAEFKNGNNNNYLIWLLFGLSMLILSFGIFYVFQKKGLSHKA